MNDDVHESAVEDSSILHTTSRANPWTKCRSRMASSRSVSPSVPSPSPSAVATTTHTLKPFSAAHKFTRKTRKSADIFGLSNVNSKEDSIITGARANESASIALFDVLCTRGASKNRIKWQSAKLVMSKVVSFYKKAKIPTISERKECEKMNQLLEDNAKVRAIPCNRRSLQPRLRRWSEWKLQCAEMTTMNLLNCADCPKIAGYQVSSVNLKALNVTNDCAERGVKLSYDFSSSAKSEEHYQNSR